MTLEDEAFKSEVLDVIEHSPYGRVVGYNPECGAQALHYGHHMPPGTGCGYRRWCRGFCDCGEAKFPHKWHLVGQLDPPLHIGENIVLGGEGD